MKRSDWLANKEPEVVRPTRLFSLTDEILDEIKKNHKGSMGNWPENRLHWFTVFLEGLPEYIDESFIPGTDYGLKNWECSSDRMAQLWAFKTGNQGCIINLIVSQPGIKWNHSWIISKDKMGAFVIDNKMSYPVFDQQFDPVDNMNRPMPSPVEYDRVPDPAPGYWSTGGSTESGTSGSAGVPVHGYATHTGVPAQGEPTWSNGTL